MYHHQRYLEDPDHLADETDEFHHDEDGEDHADSSPGNKPWGQVIGASLLIMVVTFSGLLVLGFVSCFQRLQAASPEQKKSFWHRLHHQIIPSFASGALLATTVFLLIPEGFELLEGNHGHERIEGYASAAPEEEHHDDHDEDDHRRFRRVLQTDAEEHHDEADSHNGAAWRLGASLLGGFLVPILLGAIFPPPDISDCEVCRERALREQSNLSPAAKEEIVDDAEEDSEYDVDQDYRSSTKNQDVEDPTEHLQTTMDLNCDDGDCTHCHDHIKEVTGLGENNNNKTSLTNKKSEDAIATATGMPSHPRNIPLAASIIMGDFCHNFCDGIFLGTAFLLCSNSIAWTLVATTIYHEIAQEIADFALLTHHCGLTIPQALAANFVAGLSVMLGGLIVLAVTLSDRAVGAILCISAGVYIYIAASECIPRIQAARRQLSDTLTFLLCFVLGAVPIGLVLLNHGHCSEGDDGHEDH